MEENKRALSDSELDEVTGGIDMDAPPAVRTAQLRVSGRDKAAGKGKKGGFKTAQGVGIQSSITLRGDGPRMI